MKKNLKGFTLMEFLVASTIVVLLTLMTYVPYSHYQNKAKIKIASREISQSFYESKNMATWWITSNNSNKSVWLYITTDPLTSNTINFFSYPYDIEEINITNSVWWFTELIKEKKLQDWVSIVDLWTYDNLLFFYESITWKSKIYTFNSWNKIEVIDDILEITISYKNSSSDSLKSRLNYYTNTNIIDYK